MTQGPWLGSALHPTGFGEQQERRRGQLWVQGTVSSQAGQVLGINKANTLSRGELPHWPG